MFSLRVIVVLASIAVVAFVLMYNKKAIAILSQLTIFSSGILYNLVGKRVRAVHESLHRRVIISKGTNLNKGFIFFDELLMHLGMKEQGVTVTGLVFFLIITSGIGAFILTRWLGGVVFYILLVFSLFVLQTVLLYLTSLRTKERMELDIMDAVDLLVSDLTDGVLNAITRYTPSFHPNIRPYFVTFLDDINKRGYSFTEAMLLLESSLGPLFHDFASKAIIYEAEADETLDGIFSAILESNRHRRHLRYNNTLKFNELKYQFLVSAFLIGAYGTYVILTEPVLVEYMLGTTLGKLVLIFDILLVAGVLGYLGAIKASTL